MPLMLLLGCFCLHSSDGRRDTVLTERAERTGSNSTISFRQVENLVLADNTDSRCGIILIKTSRVLGVGIIEQINKLSLKNMEKSYGCLAGTKSDWVHAPVLLSTLVRGVHSPYSLLLYFILFKGTYIFVNNP